ncbi:hypothetical protein [Thalassobaculum litoreum]|uniref:Uncharacterized protein n=1 Tax=Thalassobaculum litoreum DSM 18839 TaxID=1123362 RepID=A0A8G2BI02_9PROT|nr:hypothetical protein [Thalassobaculum litoreum]SDF83177.1 hypothetical protein SAMN05660686_02453 [Thalassobaculum litoreum DSM 18839]
METINLPMTLPACSQHGAMSIRKPATKEQAFCGTWYGCERCGAAVLFPSKELEQQNASS